MPSLSSSWFAFVLFCLFVFYEGGGGCKPKQCNEFKSLICVYSQLERLDQLFEEEPFLLLAGIKCTSPWPVTMVTTTLNMGEFTNNLCSQKLGLSSFRKYSREDNKSME